MRSGDDRVEYSGKRTERRNATHAMMLVLDLVRRIAGLAHLALVILVRWNGRSESNDRVAITFVLGTAKK